MRGWRDVDEERSGEMLVRGWRDVGETNSLQTPLI